MAVLLPILYLLLLILQVLLLILNIRKPLKKRWTLLFVSEAVSEAAAVLLMRYYNQLPGTGMMPGMTYFAETIYSMIAAAVYCGMLLLSAIVMLSISRHQKTK